MKTNLRYRSPNAQPVCQRKMEAQLKHLRGLTTIHSAEIMIEHQREAKPAFRVQVRLEVPGPDEHVKDTRHKRKVIALLHGTAMHTVVRDNTLEGSLLKATRDLEHQILAQQLHRVGRAAANCNSAPVSAAGSALKPAVGPSYCGQSLSPKKSKPHENDQD